MPDEIARLNSLLESILGSGASDLTDSDGPHTVDGWDSARHLDIIMAIEAEFDIFFDTDEIPNMVSVGAIRRKLLSE